MAFVYIKSCLSSHSIPGKGRLKNGGEDLKKGAKKSLLIS
jgi:hypothetical protein